MWKTCEMDISWKFRLTFRLENYIWSLPLWIWTQMRHLGTLIPRFCTEFRYESYGQSGLARGAIFEKCSNIKKSALFSKYARPFFQEQVPKISFSPSVHRQLPWLVLQYFQIHELYQNCWIVCISGFTDPENCWIFNISRSPAIQNDWRPIFHIYFTCFSFWTQIPFPASSIQWILQHNHPPRSSQPPPL